MLILGLSGDPVRQKKGPLICLSTNGPGNQPYLYSSRTHKFSFSTASLPRLHSCYAGKDLEGVRGAECKVLCAVLLDTVGCVTLHLKGDEAARADNGGESPRPVGPAAKASGSAGLEVEDGQHRSQSSTVYVYLLIRSK